MSTINEPLIGELSNLIANHIPKRFWRDSLGVSVDADWLRDTLNGDESLTRRVLMKTGFRPSFETTDTWLIGAGRKPFDELAGCAFEDTVKAILNEHRSA